MYLKGIYSKKTYNQNSINWHGLDYEPMDIVFQPTFNLPKILKRPTNLWRYREALPIDKKAEIISFNEGFTPIIPVLIQKNLEVLVKLEQLFSTGSYKDRGATVLMTKINSLGINHIVQDSSGNAGASIAAYAAKASIKCDIYLPEETSNQKILQMKAYGATIMKIKGNRQETANIAFEAAKSSYYASHSFNPYFFEGTKTFAFEVCEQLNWKAPDSVVIPVGNGTLLLGCYIGFNELANAGIISKIPKLIAVQAQNCNPLVGMFNGEINIEHNSAIHNNSIAEGISITNPLRGNQIVDAIKKTKGTIISVSENEIIEAWKNMAMQGHYIEPTSAAAIAGVKIYANSLLKKQKIVTLFTGNGLKSTDKIAKILS